jgi:hypothetical protein
MYPLNDLKSTPKGPFSGLEYRSKSIGAVTPMVRRMLARGPFLST